MSSFASKFRPVSRIILNNVGKSSPIKTISRNAGTAMYRAHYSLEPKPIKYAGTALSAFLWYWILYHCYFEFDHLVPNHKFPDPREFTDEELGIPPDDEE